MAALEGRSQRKAVACLEKNNLKTDSQRRYNGQNGSCVDGKEEFKRQKLKSEKQIFFSPMSNLKTVKSIHPIPEIFFLLFEISTGHLSSGTFHPNYPKFQCSEKHICVIKKKEKLILLMSL